MAASKQHEHTCEVCRTLGDVVRALEKLRYGPGREVSLAIRAALELHKERADKTEEGNHG